MTVAKTRVTEMFRNAVLALVVLFVAAGCGEASGQALSTPQATGGVAAASAVAAPSPSPSPRERAVVVSTNGTGSKVPRIHLVAAKYVVSWTAKGGECFGSAGCLGDNFIVHVIGDNFEKGIINEITSDNIEVGSSGESFYQVPQTGDYLLKVDASELTWTITFTPV